MGLPSSSSSPSSPDPSSTGYDVYLTCSVRTGAELCSLIKINLERRGITVFHSDQAARRNENIIQETDHGFQWLARDDMHEDVRDVPSYNSVRWVHEYQDACITKLDKFIRGGGDTQLKVDSPYLCRSLARSRQSSGRSTPSGMSRKSSANPLCNNLLHPRNISLRKSSLSLYSNDSGVDYFN